MILNIIRSLSRFFPYHLVPTSPWPLLVSFSLLSLTLSAVMYMHGYPNGGIFLSLGFTITALSLVLWLRYMVKEATYEGAQVQNGLVIGFVLFIVLVIALLLLFLGILPLPDIIAIGLKIKSFSLSSKIKLALIAFFIFVTLILLYLDFKSIEETETNLNAEIKQSGIRLPKSFKYAFVGVGPAFITYYTLVENKLGLGLSARLQKAEDDQRELMDKLSKLEAENNRLSEKDLEIKTKATGLVDSLHKVHSDTHNHMRKFFETEEKLSTINALKLQAGQKVTPDQTNLIKEEKFLEETKAKKMIDKNMTEAKELSDIDKFAKSSFLPIDFDYREFLKSLEAAEVVLVGNLFLDSVILSSTITIISQLYGDLLIKRFDLENRYPKLHGIIRYRKKIQKYTLIYSFTMIFVGIIPQICMSLFVLYPKFMEFIS